MAKFIDIKETIWRRVQVDDNTFYAFVNGLNNGESDTSMLYDSPDYEHEMLYETTEEVTVEENNHQPTIECYDDGLLIADNTLK